MRCVISRGLLEGIRRESADAAPREACGLLFGDGDTITGWNVTRNVAEEPERRFEIDPAALFAALKAERSGGPKLAGYWHSHPSGDAMPSRTDAAMAAPDGKLWLIVAGEDLTLWRPVERPIFRQDRATGGMVLHRNSVRFERVAARTGDIRHLLPRDKSDEVLVPLLAEAGWPAIAPFLDELFSWTADSNWPVARALNDFFVTLGEPVVEPLRRILRGSDGDHKWHSLSGLVWRLPFPIRAELEPDMIALAEQPGEIDRQFGVDMLAREILADWRGETG